MTKHKADPRAMFVLRKTLCLSHKAIKQENHSVELSWLALGRYFVENYHFALGTLRVANRSPTPASKINDFLGLFDDIWGPRPLFPADLENLTSYREHCSRSGRKDRNSRKQSEDRLQDMLPLNMFFQEPSWLKRKPCQAALRRSAPRTRPL